MYGIYTVDYWTRLPIRDPKTIANWIEIEGSADFESDNLDVIFNEMKNVFAQKAYFKHTDDGKYGITECLLCYIVDDKHNIIGAFDFDKNVCMF